MPAGKIYAWPGSYVPDQEVDEGSHVDFGDVLCDSLEVKGEYKLPLVAAVSTGQHLVSTGVIGETVWSTPLGGGGNPFDQDLNTFDDAAFVGVDTEHLRLRNIGTVDERYRYECEFDSLNLVEEPSGDTVFRVSPGAFKNVAYFRDVGIFANPGESCLFLQAGDTPVHRMVRTDPTLADAGTRYMNGMNGDYMWFGQDSATGQSLVTKSNIGDGLIQLSPEGQVTAEAMETKSMDITADLIVQVPRFSVYSAGNILATVVVEDIPTPVLFDHAVLTSGQHLFTAETLGVNIGRMTYTGNRTRYVHLVCTASFSTDKVTIVVKFFLAKNGVLIPGSQIVAHGNGQNKYLTTTLNSTPSLSTGDLLDLWVVCDKDAAVLVENISFSGVSLPNTV